LLSLIERLDLLAKLPSVHTLKAGYDRVESCAPGTRVAPLSTILSRLSSTESGLPQVIWLQGLAGVGKSTLSASIARSLDKDHLLGGCFFFSRNSDDRSSTEFIFSTIASQIAVRVPRLADGILSSLEEDPALGDSAPATQFRKLIAEPIKKNAAGLSLPVVLILDALDECTEPSLILSPIREELPNLPKTFKILITSRPEQRIQNNLEAIPSLYQYQLTHDRDVSSDIEIFIKQRLAAVAQDYGLGPNWPGDASCNALVQKAGGLFIWASTAVKIIGDMDVDNPQTQLRSLLHTGETSPIGFPWKDLDKLYLQILHQSFGENSEQSRFILFRQVVGGIVNVKSPLTAAALGSILDISTTPDAAGQPVNQVVRRLHSVLLAPDDGPLQIIHPSFADFLTDPQRCTDVKFFINPSEQHSFLTLRSLRIMIGSFESYGSDGSSKQHYSPHDVPESLQYACHFWADHISVAPFGAEIYTLLKSFYVAHLLRWLAVLSVLSASINTATRLLALAEAWLVVSRAIWPRWFTQTKLTSL
jgi:hypothetical protein